MKNLIFKWSARLFLPHLAKQMEREGFFSYPSGPVEDEDYVHVEDRGGDVTIVCFSGMAVLFAGLPRFEFRRLLRKGLKEANLVFFRDLSRMGYCLAPDGKGDGAVFYEAKVREIIADLGSSRNIALGASAGGTAALALGTRCGFDHVIAFSPVLDPKVYGSVWHALGTVVDFKSLLTQPKAYVEQVLVAVAGGYIYRKILRLGGTMPDLVELYRNASPNRPHVTLFYGSRCRADAYQVSLVADLPEVDLVPVDTGHHNCPAHLKKEGRLGSAIQEAIRGRQDATVADT